MKIYPAAAWYKTTKEIFGKDYSKPECIYSISPFEILIAKFACTTYIQRKKKAHLL